jgi:hypothetical protein
MYKAGVKKYGKEGMKKIQQAAGKKLGHAEIGKIKDRYDKKKKESAYENINKRVKVKEVFKWMKGLEEYRYRKVPAVDVRRITSFINNGIKEDELPESLKKKWKFAEYKREKHLANKFLKTHKVNEDLDPYKDFGTDNNWERNYDLNLGSFVEHYQDLIKFMKKYKVVPDKNKRAWANAIRNKVGRPMLNGHMSQMRNIIDLLKMGEKFRNLKDKDGWVLGESINEEKYIVYVDKDGKGIRGRKIVKSGLSQMSAKRLYNKLVKTDDYQEVGYDDHKSWNQNNIEKIKESVNEDLYYGYYKNKEVKVNAKSDKDAKKQIISKLKIPKGDLNRASMINHTKNNPVAEGKANIYGIEYRKVGQSGAKFQKSSLTMSSSQGRKMHKKMTMAIIQKAEKLRKQDNWADYRITVNGAPYIGWGGKAITGYPPPKLNEAPGKNHKDQYVGQARVKVEPGTYKGQKVNFHDVSMYRDHKKPYHYYLSIKLAHSNKVDMVVDTGTHIQSKAGKWAQGFMKRRMGGTGNERFS